MKVRLVKYLLLAVIWILHSSQTIKFSHFTINDGLSQSSVKCIFQDSEGFLWVGTADGLNKYNGYEFENIKSDPDNKWSISGNDISCIYENPYDSTLWIGTQNAGINLYDRNLSKFKCFKYLTGSLNGIPQNFISDMVSTSDGTLWVATKRAGLCYFDPADSTFLRTEFSKIAKYRQINTIIADNADKLWIGTQTGLYLWDYKEPGSHPQKILPGNDKLELKIKALKFDSKGFLWIGTLNNGIYRFHPANHQITHYSANDQNAPLSNNRVNAIEIRENGEVWIGTQRGLNKFDPDLNGFIVYRNEQNNVESINNNTIYSLFEDNSGVLWIGTYLGGLNKLDRLQFRFPKLDRLETINNNKVLTNDVRSIALDSDNTLWISSSGGLVYIKEGNDLPEITKNNAQIYQGIKTGAVFSIREGILVSSVKGICLISSDKTLKNISPEIERQTGKNITHFSSALRDDQNNVWLATSQGLLKYSLDDKKFANYNPKGPDGVEMLIQALTICEDQSGILWIGTLDGNLYSFNPFTQEYDLHLSKELAPDKKISFDRIFSVCKGANDNIWLGTNMGLYSYFQKSKKLNRYLEKNGLSNEVIYSVLGDQDDNIWCSTNRGINMLNTKTKKIYSYFSEDGLQSNEFNQGAYFKDNEGKIYLGGINGLNVFQPKEIVKNRFVAPIILNRLEINHEKVTPHSHPDILSKDISQSSYLELNSQQNTFGFEFVALSFSLPERNTYQYTFTKNGEDDDWVDAGNRRYVSFTNVSEGEYIFKVKGLNSDGLLTQTRSLNISVYPPWWKTIWAKMSTIALILVIIYFIVYGRTRKIQRQKIVLKKLVKANVSQIEKKNKKLQIFNDNIIKQNEKIQQKNKRLKEQSNQIIKQNESLLRVAEKLEETNQGKLRFFTSISHELKTPLLFINNPIKDVLKNINTYDKAEISNKLNNAQKYTSKLLLYINQIADFRKVDTENMRLQLSNLNLVQFLQDFAFMFSQFAEEKNINFEFSSEVTELTISADKDKLEKVIFNLISNAFEACSKNGSITVSLRVKNDNNEQYAEISVKDDGIGIKEEELPHIFDRFYQSDLAGKQKSGSGLGLALAKKYAMMHQGSIEVKSDYGKGSTFMLRIPSAVDQARTTDQIESSATTNKEIMKASIGDYVPYVTESDNGNTRLKSILYVYDDPNMMNYIKDTLSGKFEIIKAKSTNEGLKLAQTKQPSLIISDTELKEKSGYDFCKTIKEDIHTNHIPIILLDSGETETGAYQALGSGADAVIQSPLDIQLLILQINNLLEGRKVLQKKFSLIDPSTITKIPKRNKNEVFLAQAIHCVDEHLKDPQFNVDKFCVMLNLSQPQCYRKIKSATGYNITEFIRNTRLKRAANMLQSGNYKINEVAYETGFNDANYFTKSFTKVYGLTPSEYVNSL